MFLYYKKRYQTCLQMLDCARKEFTVLKDEILSYAGVLDPMAEGWVTVLVGKEENRERVKYTQATKEYYVDVLLGVSTDSGDLMGVVENCSLSAGSYKQDEIMKIISAISSFPDLYEQRVSRLANKKFQGKPLWLYALEDRYIADEDLPLNEVQLFERELVAMYEISEKVLIDDLVSMGEVFGGNFRMDRILPSWNRLFGERLIEKAYQYFKIITLRLKVSKGFFVREFVKDVSRQVNYPLVIYRLKRTKVEERDLVTVI